MPDALGDLQPADRKGDTRLGRRSAHRRLCAYGSFERPAGIARPAATRTSQCRGADRDRHRHRTGAAPRWRGGDGECLLDPGPRPAHRRCGSRPRFSDHSRSDPGFVRRLRAAQFADRLELPAHRSSYPLLMNGVAQELVLQPTAEVAAARPGALTRAARNWSVRIGAVSLALLALVSICAPWIASADPTLLDPANRDLLPGARVTFTLSDGNTVSHVFR